MQLSQDDCDLRDAIEHAWNMVGTNAARRETGSDLDILRSENDRLNQLVKRLQNSETAKEATINMLLDRLYEAKSAGR